MTFSIDSQTGTRRIMVSQAIVLLFFVLVLAVGTSWTLSEKLSNPIVNMSVSARKLAQGDYTVKFYGNGYNEIDELAETLNYATAQLANTEQMRKDIVANVSHDLKTPLTLIKSYAEMLRDFPNASQQKKDERIEVIIREADRITQLVTEMTQLSISETGNLVLNKEIFCISDVVTSAAESFSVKVGTNGNLTTVITPNLFVLADKSQISQVIYNFVDNAFNYTNEHKEIRLELKETNDFVRFDCFDNGCGLSDEEKTKIWDRYYRASHSYSRKSGTGLGLSISKTVLLAHDAKYGVNSVDGQGSDFYFELPIAHTAHNKQQTID